MAAPPPPPLFLMPGVEPEPEPDSIKPAKPGRGRKPSKVPPPNYKKERKRGMGVFQLEQLRMAREAAETIRNNSDLEPIIISGLEDQNQNQNLNQPKLGPFWINPYSSSSASVYETSTELSSIPNIVQQTPSDFCCCCCFKKKKKKKFINGDECTVYNVRKEHFSEMSMTISGSDFQGLNLENNFKFYDQKRAGFNSRAATSAFYSNNKLAVGGRAEVVAVHRKNPKSGRNVFMEYEFFPDSKNGTVFKETRFQNPAESSSDGGGKAPSCLTALDYSANSIDLSLKLSF